MGKLLDINTISQVDVVESLKHFVAENLSAEVANDGAIEFASELTGISVDRLLELIDY